MYTEGNDAPAIGIDLGTTYSCVALWKNDRIEIIPNDQGNRTTPSSVAFVDAERLVGDGARNQAAMNPANSIFDAKRLIGRRYSDPNVQADLKLWPFRVTQGPADTPKIVVTYKGQDKEFLAEEISSMILGKMKETAGAYLGKVVKDAVLTVPAYFNDSQRQATKDAATISGLNVIRMINEPTAAAIAYGMDNKSDILGKINVLIFDLGGGTFDVSVMTIEEGGIFEVKAVAGDPHLGGEDFDNNMAEHCVQEFKRKWSTDLTGNQRALGRLRFACEKAKRVLSSTTQTLIELDCFHEGIDFSMKFSRAKFEELNMDLFNKCMETMKTCLSDAKMEKSHVNQVILVGGSTRIPKIQGMVEELFDGKELSKSLNPDEAVAYGAAIMAAKLSGNCNKSVQDEAKVSVNGNKSVKDVLLHDVTPLSLGIDLIGERFHVIIPRNTPIPTMNFQKFVTIEDNQTKMPFKVYQGERSKSTDNHFLGEFTISGLPLAPRGVTSVMIYFEIDANDILTVTAGITSTGKMEKLTITNKNRGLSEEEITKMINDANKYKLEDKEFKKRADAYIALDLYLCRMKRLIKPYKIVRWVDPGMWKIKKAATNTTKWLQENQNASVSELELMKSHLEFVCRGWGI